MFLAMVNAKGGVGKSTLAVHLAVWLHERGQRVMLVDCDLQRSSSQWMAEAAPEVRVEVLLSEDELIERAPVFQQEVDIVVADGPAGLKKLTRALLLVCDTAFIPYSQNTRTRVPARGYAPSIAYTSACLPPR